MRLQWRALRPSSVWEAVSVGAQWTNKCKHFLDKKKQNKCKHLLIREYNSTEGYYLNLTEKEIY
jgi:hypothetical protein